MSRLSLSEDKIASLVLEKARELAAEAGDDVDIPKPSITRLRLMGPAGNLWSIDYLNDRGSEYVIGAAERIAPYFDLAIE